MWIPRATVHSIRTDSDTAACLYLQTPGGFESYIDFVGTPTSKTSPPAPDFEDRSVAQRGKEYLYESLGMQDVAVLDPLKLSAYKTTYRTARGVYDASRLDLRKSYNPRYFELVKTNHPMFWIADKQRAQELKAIASAEEAHPDGSIDEVRKIVVRCRKRVRHRRDNHFTVLDMPGHSGTLIWPFIRD